MTPPRRPSPRRGKNPALVRNGTKNAKLRADVLRIYGPRCHLCGGAIDLTLRYPHPMSYEVDHLVPVSLGGPMYDPSTCRPAHRRHNGQRGARSIAAGREAIQKPPRAAPPKVTARREDPSPPPGWGSGPERTDLTW